MKKILPALLLSVALMLVLASCGNTRSIGSEPSAAASAEVSQSAEPQPSPSGADQPAAESAREDGERFETVIVIEGMEETVRYEHIRSETAGFEMDYDYESFVRHSEADRECLVSVWDRPEDPVNYLEVRYDPGDAELVASAVSEALSNDYEIAREPYVLDGTGSCIRIDASEARDGGVMPDLLQTVYIIPASDGCRVATAHFSIESAEGFGRRFSYMMKTLTVIDRSGEGKLSDGQALAAVKAYCFISNPDLESIVNAGEYPVSWSVSSSDEHEIVVLFSSYTGAQIRYYIDRITGETYVTEFVPGITAEEERTEERINMWEYLS